MIHVLLRWTIFHVSYVELFTRAVHVVWPPQHAGRFHQCREQLGVVPSIRISCLQKRGKFFLKECARDGTRHPPFGQSESWREVHCNALDLIIVFFSVGQAMSLFYRSQSRQCCVYLHTSPMISATEMIAFWYLARRKYLPLSETNDLKSCMPSPNSTSKVSRKYFQQNMLFWVWRCQTPPWFTWGFGCRRDWGPFCS